MDGLVQCVGASQNIDGSYIANSSRIGPERQFRGKYAFLGIGQWSICLFRDLEEKGL